MVAELLEKIAASLNAAGIAYMVVGGEAVLIYGEVRLTKDVDVTLGIGPERYEDIVKVAAEQGWRVLVTDPCRFVQDSFVLPCEDPASGRRIDFMFSTFPYERQALSRAHRKLVGSTEVCFASVEDLIVHKVIAGRPRDIEDIRGILLRQKSIDVQYIRHWLTQFEQLLSRSFVDTFEKLHADAQIP
jgi:predicted nucleotidyltransferase